MFLREISIYADEQIVERFKGGFGHAFHKRQPKSSVCIDWYAVVEVDGVQITVRFIGRRGRRGRIAIEAPAGAVFQSTPSWSM